MQGESDSPAPSSFPTLDDYYIRQAAIRRAHRSVRRLKVRVWWQGVVARTESGSMTFGRFYATITHDRWTLSYHDAYTSGEARYKVLRRLAEKLVEDNPGKWGAFRH
jgi:hypothetical protein